MPRKNTRNTKGRIISAAWKLFYEQGYEDTTVEDIVFESETSKGSFYHYFDGKDALLGTLALCAAIEGWLLRRTNILFRLMLLVGGLCMLVPGSMTDALGVGLMAAVAVIQFLQNKKDGPHTAEVEKEAIRVETVDHIEIDDEVD